ncbi:hypothetical protein BLNAU_11661 [Blattamonas nauphoetae]|uniref:Uncharacterized protein n=1 Tax=Blattamonas nauphoetae TaxID=2049346 RepID=A0ABQ9XLT0_9EUKA|nr:hypothetical protein BLNAU_11661 [Blattamonas nauphoetae]
MLFLFALLAASSFKVPNDTPTFSFEITPPTIDADGNGKIKVVAAGLTDPDPVTPDPDPEVEGSNAYAALELKLVYTPTTGDAITLSKTELTPVSGDLTHTFDIKVADTGSTTVFQHGVKYALTTVTVEGVDPRSGTADEAFTPTIPTLALTYSEATTTTFTLTATFTDDKIRKCESDIQTSDGHRKISRGHHRFWHNCQKDSNSDSHSC